MNPLLSGLMGGVSSLVGGIFNSQSNAQTLQAQEQMQAQSEGFNAQQAQLNRDFQQQMSSTAYQRSTQDMEKAGLNPMMMFGSGGPASVPSGSTASVGTPSAAQQSSPFSGVGPALQKGLDAMVTAKTVDKMSDEIANLRTQRGLLSAETGLVGEKTSTQEAQTKIAQAGTYSAALEAAKAKSIGDMPQWLFDAANRGQFLGRAGNDFLAPIINSAGAVRPWIGTRTKMQTSHDGDDTFTDRWSGVGGAW